MLSADDEELMASAAREYAEAEEARGATRRKRLPVAEMSVAPAPGPTGPDTDQLLRWAADRRKARARDGWLR